jgi:pyruvate-ferredoxin/flavodoxin oxidoreductase
MGCSQLREKQAVDAGYWHLYRYNPELKKSGENPFILDSKEPSESFREFLMGEVRYASLTKTFPEIAEELFTKAEKDAREKYEKYRAMAQSK